MTTPDLFGTSPFDAIRRTRPDGSEFWSARDLQLLMAYSTWQHFEVPLRRAMKAAENEGLDVEHHFTESRKNPRGQGGRPAVDYELSRKAAYLVAINGDPNKPECAAGQAYFVTKTREAEVAPRHEVMLPKSYAEALRELASTVEARERAEAALVEATPAIEYHDRFVDKDAVSTIKAWGAQFGLTQPKAFDLLIDRGLIYSERVGRRFSKSKNVWLDEYEYRARSGKCFTYFDSRPQDNVSRRHNGQVRRTLYVRQAHAIDLARAAGLGDEVIFP